MDSKLQTYLGFASKSGNLQFGFAKTEESAKRKKAKLIVFSGGISEKTKKEIFFISEKYGVRAAEICCTNDEFQKATGKPGLVVAIEDESFASAVEKRLN